MRILDCLVLTYLCIVLHLVLTNFCNVLHLVLNNPCIVLYLVLNNICIALYLVSNNICIFITISCIKMNNLWILGIFVEFVVWESYKIDCFSNQTALDR